MHRLAFIRPLRCGSDTHVAIVVGLHPYAVTFGAVNTSAVCR
jgi:hypothetical protein